MELIEGKTLRELMQSGWTSDSFSNVARQIAQALTVAHAAGITHRDIKPENIMVREDGYAKLLDFGLVRLPPDGANSESPTEPGLLVGTARYMSPEQAQNQELGTDSDIFSLGVVLYEMATGQHHFGSDLVIGTCKEIVLLESLTHASES